jgi:hypothetical protein
VLAHGLEVGLRYLFTKYLMTKMKRVFFFLLLYIIMSQVRIEVLLPAGILYFDHFEIYD